MYCIVLIIRMGMVWVVLLVLVLVVVVGMLYWYTTGWYSQQKGLMVYITHVTLTTIKPTTSKAFVILHYHLITSKGYLELVPLWVCAYDCHLLTCPRTSVHSDSVHTYYCWWLAKNTARTKQKGLQTKPVSVCFTLHLFFTPPPSQPNQFVMAQSMVMIRLSKNKSTLGHIVTDNCGL